METVQGMLTGKNLVKGKTFVRPVLGGTGRYAGASGVVITRRLSGNRYDQVFKLKF